MPKTLLAVGLLVLSSIHVGCTDPVRMGSSEDGMQRFFTLPLERQHFEFRTYPFDKQYAIYMYSMERRHPPDLSFAYEIAARGKEVVPMLLQKVKETGNEWEQDRIIYVFVAMARQDSYDVKSDHNLIKTLRATVASMQKETVRENSSRYLAEIVGTS